MSRITQRGAVGLLSLFQGLAETVTTAPFSQSYTDVGQKFDTADGRELVLVLNGTTALHAGVLVQGAAYTADHQNCDVTAVQTGTTSLPYTVTFTLGATAVTANQYAGGFLNVNDNNGEGQLLQIASHPAADASASLTVTLSDPWVTAVTAASEVSLIPNPYNGVVIMPTTPTGPAVGVTLDAISASVAGTTNNFGFLVKNGLTSCLNDGALTVGSAVSPSNAVAGAVENGVIAQGFVGNAAQTGADTEYRMIYVNL